MSDRSVVVKLRAEVDQFVAGMQKARTEASTFGREMSGHGKTAKADLETIGRGAAIAATGIAVGFGLAAKSAMDWESAWAGVTKTVDGSAAEMADLETGLRDLAKELPATHGEIAAVAEAAGALGIQRSAIEGFTKTMIDLGETTNVTSDQAATAFARIANIMGTSQTDFDRMGSTLVDLGNKGASTESEILELANRLAAAGHIAGLTEADVFAMASTLASVGVEAEAGGTALSKVFTTVSDAVLDGSDKLDTFARVANVTSDQFAASFRDDPATAINEFIEGLGRMIDSGQSLTPVFEDLELTDSRLMNALKSTAGAGELLNDQLQIGRAAWEANNALQTEAEKRYDTTAAKMEMARNQIVDLGINVGDVLLPAISSTIGAVSTMAQGFGEMPGPLEAVGVGIGGVALAVTGMVAGATLIVPKIVAARNALLGMGAAGKVAAASMPWLAAGAAVLGTVAYVFGENAKQAEEAEERVKGFTDAIREAGDETEGVRTHVEGLVSDNAGLAELLDKTGTSVDDLASALSGGREGFDKFKSGLMDTAKGADLSNDATAALMFGLDDMRTSTVQAADDADRLGRLLNDTDSAASGASGSVGALTEELGLNAEEAQKARDAFQDLLDAHRASVDPLFGMLDALEANRDAVRAEAAARTEGAAAVKDASDRVAEAEKNLRDARGKKDNAEGIAAAEERLADARSRLSDVQADAAITAEELAEMNEAAAQSALDVDVAAKKLAASIADDTVTLEGAKGMLKEWADQGLLTKEQAYLMGIEFDNAATKADNLAGDYVLNFYNNAAETAGAIDKVTAALSRMNEQIRLNPYSADVTQAEKFVVRAVAEAKAAAGGGMFGAGEWGWVGEEGPELVRFGSAAQVYPHGDSMAMYGSSIGVGSSVSYDQSRRNSFEVKPTIYEAVSPRATAVDVAHEMKVMAAGMAA